MRRTSTGRGSSRLAARGRAGEAGEAGDRGDGAGGERRAAVRVAAHRVRPPLSGRRVREVITAVLEGERRSAGREARRSVRSLRCLNLTFLSAPAMRQLNRTWKGRDCPTDVLAFALPEPGGGLTGDVYICPAVAAAEARSRRIPARQELIRLVVHGLLHVLGYDHPASAARMHSRMWRRQERYVKVLA